MIFVILILLLGGLAMVASGIENSSITTYIQSWFHAK